MTDTTTLLTRANTDENPVMGLRHALLSAGTYRTLPGFEEAGAITISTYIARDEDDAATLIAATRWTVFGLATIGTLRQHGLTVAATTIVDEIGQPVDAYQDRHVDVIVAAYPPGHPPYGGQLTKTQKQDIRGLLLEPFERAVRLFDPRRAIGPIRAGE